MYTIIIFIILSILNVIGSTIRSLLTINSNKYVASLSSALYFAFYTIVIVYMVADFPLWIKCLITFICNLIGVFIVKLIEEKKKPVKLWKVEIALPESGKRCTIESYEKWFNEQKISCNYSKIGQWYIFNCYCDTKQQVDYLIGVCRAENGKISAYENKI